MLDPDMVHKLIENTPFILSHGNGKIRIDWPQLVQFIVALAIMVFVLRSEVADLRNDLNSLKGTVEQMRHDLYAPKSDLRYQK